MDIGKKIERIRESKKITREELAEKLGVTSTTIFRKERGKGSSKREFRGEEIQQYADALGVPITDLLLGADGIPMVPLLGYVGAGSEVFAIDDYAPGASLEEVECPTGHSPENIIALRVRGDSMEPQIEDGWIIFYKRKYNDGVPPECIGQLCVVKLKNDGMLVKKLRQGSAPGLYHLYSKNQAHEPIIDARIEWASKVIDIRPR